MAIAIDDSRTRAKATAYWVIANQHPDDWERV